MTATIPKRYHALIRIAQIVLKKPTCDITESDVTELTRIMQNHIQSGMSPKDIQQLYDITYTDFGMFLKKCLKLKLVSIKDAVNNYYQKTGRSITDEKLFYKKQCQFVFDPYQYTNIPGYNLLKTAGIYHPVNNPHGVCRDHMVSKEYGFRNNIPVEMMSHPANCQFITNYDNIKKGESSILNIDQLISRITDWNLGNIQLIDSSYKKLSKTADHKLKIKIGRAHV